MTAGFQPGRKAWARCVPSVAKPNLRRAVALEIRRVRVRDGFRVLDVKIERILSASSFVHGALLYAAPTLKGIPRHRECARILDADIRLQHIAIIDHAKPLDNMEFFRVRRAEIIDIGLVVDADRIDHESIAFVVPDRLAGPARLDVRRMRYVQINPPPVETLLVDHDDHVCGLYEVKGVNGVEYECRHPQRDAAHLNRIAGFAGKYPFIAL